MRRQMTEREEMARYGASQHGDEEHEKYKTKEKMEYSKGFRLCSIKRTNG